MVKKLSLQCLLVIFIAAISHAQNAPVLTESDRFFIEYDRAAGMMNKGEIAAAALVMDALYKSLTLSPWMELALEKRSEAYDRLDVGLAIAGYQELLQRLTTAPFYKGQGQRSELLRRALTASAQRGIARGRLYRVREALGQYYIRYHEYPESIAKLPLLHFIDRQDVLDANDRLFQYFPKGQQIRAKLSYTAYDLERPKIEPFSVVSPRIEATTRTSETPERYAALIRVAAKQEPKQVTEDQLIEGYFVATITARGVVVCSPERVLILPAGH